MEFNRMFSSARTDMLMGGLSTMSRTNSPFNYRIESPSRVYTLANGR